MPGSGQAIIIGAGVMGAGTAYWLAKGGLRVTIIEKESIGSGASGVAAAMLTESSPADPLHELSAASIVLHREWGRVLQGESGVDFGYRENPTIHLAFSDDEASALKADMEARRGAGQPCEWLEGEALRKAEPLVAPDALGGMLSDQQQVIAYPFTLALATAAERHGAQLRHGEVVGLESAGRRVTGVRLASGEVLGGDCVVVAAGPWTQYAGPWAGVLLPVFPVRGQILELRAPEPHLQASLSGHGMYVVHKANGLTLAGATAEFDSGFSNQVTPEGASQVMQAAVAMVPALGRAQLVNHVAGLRPCPEDGLPLIGPVPGLEGLYVVSGHFRRGMELSAASTRAIADLVTAGRTAIPIEPFAPGRFGAWR